MVMSKSQELYKKAKLLIPGGTQLLSKRPELHHPQSWPAYYEKAKGCMVWDLDGNQYIDMSYMGIGSCILGYADDDVNEAVKNVVDGGNMTTLNCPEEVRLAELLCELHPWAGMARFARSGGEAMSIAVRISRAKTKNDIILFCGYHGWHDWYLAANLADNAALDGHHLEGLSPDGVPRGLRGTSFPFQYNDKEAFLSLIKKYQGRIAAVIMEPMRSHKPDKGFLELIRETTQKEKIVLIFDEITAGWRLNSGGAHLSFGVNPDIAVFGKGMSNGYAMSAVLGTLDIMEVAQETFISSTYWTERIGPTAAVATINKIRKNDVISHLIATGERVSGAWRDLALKNALTIEVAGMPSLCHFSFKAGDALMLKTYFTQLMLEKGFLASTAFYASFAHKRDLVDRYLGSVDEAFDQIAKALREGTVKESLHGPICHSGFKRLT